MTPIERSQYSAKFLLELLSIFLIFATIYASSRLSEYRVTQVETSLKQHCSDSSTLKAQTLERLSIIRTNQAIIQTDISYIKRTIQDGKRSQ